VRFAEDRALAPGALQPVLEQGQVINAEERQKVANRSNALTSGGSLNLSQELVLRDCCFKWKRGKCLCHIAPAVVCERPVCTLLPCTMHGNDFTQACSGLEERNAMPYVATSFCAIFILLTTHACGAFS
jgi:hypothetical protein